MYSCVLGPLVRLSFILLEIFLYVLPTKVFLLLIGLYKKIEMSWGPNPHQMTLQLNWLKQRSTYNIIRLWLKGIQFIFYFSSFHCAFIMDDTICLRIVFFGQIKTMIQVRCTNWRKEFISPNAISYCIQLTFVLIITDVIKNTF